MDMVLDKKQELEALCRKYRVAKLELFGSATDDTFNPELSDLDFLVTYEELGEFEWSDAYFGLKFGLEDLFGRPVDLVMADAISNPYFRASVEETKVPLYAAA